MIHKEQNEEIGKILEALTKEPQKPGAYECSSMTFWDVVHNLIRLMGRSSDRISMLSCTMKSGGQEDVKTKMDKFQELFKFLRKSDFYARMRDDQILLLLIGNHPEQAKIVSEKLRNAWEEAGGIESEIEISLYSLEDAQ